MHLQRIVLPGGKVTWTAYDGDAVVAEIRQFVIYLEARHYAPRTVSLYARHIVRLGNYLAALGKSFREITAMDLDRFIPTLVRSGRKLDAATAMNIIPLRPERVEVSASLHNQILFGIKSFYAFLDLRHPPGLFDMVETPRGTASDSYKPFLAHIAARKSRRKVESRSDQRARAAAAKRATDHRLKPEQVLRIVQAAGLMRDIFLVIVLYATGMRIGEARGLLHEDFQLDEDVIWVTPRELENGARVKNGHPRPIPVPDFIMRMYEDYVSSDEFLPAFESGTDYVFCNITGGRVGRGLTESNVYDIQRRLVKNSGVAFTWHMFRHSHASEAIAQGYSLLDVADRLGHASPQTTNAIYKHLFNAEYRKMRLESHAEVEARLDDLRRRALTEEQIKCLTVLVRNETHDVYIGSLRAYVASVSPLLLERGRWGFHTLRECFGIDGASVLYTPPKFKQKTRDRLLREAQELAADSHCDDRFLGGVGFDFAAVPEPYLTELKAYFTWRLSRPQSRHYDWYSRAARLIPFCADLSDASKRPTPASARRYLIDFGHPIENGDGNSSTPLAEVMREWFRSEGYKTREYTGKWRIRDGAGTTAQNVYCNFTPANSLVSTLIVLREKAKPVEARDLVLFEDMYPDDELPQRKRTEPYFHFYRFHALWLRDIARRYVISKIEHRELSTTTLVSYVRTLARIDECLHEKNVSPRPEHVTQEFIDHTFLAWGKEKQFVGQNWYSDPMNMLQWASGYLPAVGWAHLAFDPRNIRRVHSYCPKGRHYERKFEEAMVPEEVVEQIFRKFETLPPVCKRLLIIVRYTGMRCHDLHSLGFDCLEPDPDDDRFMLLTFYQSKIRKWNIKPLHKDDAAHALVIQAIQDQRKEVRRHWDQDTKYLFPNKLGDVEVALDSSATREAIGAWCIRNDIRDKAGKSYAFGWHDFRHFYGTELALAGHDIHLIQMELGHASLDMSIVYVNQRLKLRKKALLEKGGGRFVTIKGEVDDRIAELAIRKDAVMAVDIPGGLCSLPGQMGEWCEHNRACFTCSYFRADVEQLPFFEKEKRSMTSTLRRLLAEVADLEGKGQLRMAEIGRKRIERTEEGMANIATIVSAIKTEGVYGGNDRKYRRPACSIGAAQCGKAALGRGHDYGNAPTR
jgi:integrase/recombinase XerD